MRIIFIIALALLASCEKPSCPTPKVTDFSGNVLRWQPAGEYTIEVEGIDGPYKGFIKATGTAQRVEGAKLRVRIKSNCSEWSEWFYHGL